MALNKLSKKYMLAYTPVETVTVYTPAYTVMLSEFDSILTREGAEQVIRKLRDAGYDISSRSVDELSSYDSADGIYWLSHTEWSGVSYPAAAQGWYIKFLHAYPAVFSSTPLVPEMIKISDAWVTIPVGASQAAYTYPAKYTEYTVGGTPYLKADTNWNSSGVSATRFLGDGQVEFSIKGDSLGVVAGLNSPTGRLSVGYNDIPYGFYASRGVYLVMELGAEKTSAQGFDEADVFKIVRLRGQIRYYVNDVEVYTSLVASTQSELLLDAALYSSGDAVFDAVVTDLVDTSNVTAAAVTIACQSSLDVIGLIEISGDYHYPRQTAIAATAQLRAQFTQVHNVQSLSGQAQLTGVPYVRDAVYSANVMQPMTGAGTDRSGYGYAQSQMQPMTALSGAGDVQISIATGKASLSPLFGFATGLTGGINTDTTQVMQPMASRSSDHNYGEGIGQLAPLSSVGYAYDLPEIDVGSGNIKIVGGGEQGCGIILPSGYHALTAAHVVDQITNPASTVITFNSELSMTPVVVKKITLHPLYVAGAEGSNYDLAVIEFENEVDPRVERHELYRYSDEIGKIFKKTSFSPAINPITGAQLGYSSFETIYNRFDLDTTVIQPAALIGTQLMYDFDDGTVARDAGAQHGASDLGLGVFEGFVSSGDSGSAALIDNKIAGITSYTGNNLADINDVSDGTYGEYASDMRVSAFIDWIELHSVVGEGRASLGGFTTTITAGSPGVATLRFPSISIQSSGEVNPITEAALTGFVTTVTGYSGAVLAASNLTMHLYSAGTNEPVGRATLRVPRITIAAGVLSGNVGRAAVPYQLGKVIEAYGGAAANLQKFTTRIDSGVLVGGYGNASAIRIPLITIVAQGIELDHATVTVRPPWMDTLYGVGELNMARMTISAKSGFDCEVL